MDEAKASGAEGCGRSGFSCAEVYEAGETYGGNFNLLEIEAELYQNPVYNYLKRLSPDYLE